VTGVATDPVYLDVSVEAGATLAVPLPRGHHAFAFVYEGDAALGAERIGRGELAVLADGDGVELAAGKAGARVLVVAGRPIGEPIAKYGPFVMNTVEELQQAFYDYQSGRF
jgi:redox-sensitive bicupin YhaK (pirin superfamily)